MSGDAKTRWTVTVSKVTNAALRAYLGVQGMGNGDISKFIEEAVRWRLFDRTVREIKARHVDRTADELQAIIDEVCRTDR